MNEAEYLENNYGDRRGCYPDEADKPSEISIILHMVRKPNSIIVLLFIQNNSQFKNIAKTCLPPSILRQCTFRFVQPHKYSPNSRCRPSCCLLVVLAIFLAIFSLVLTLETSEMSAIFCFHSLSVNGALTCTNSAFLTSFPR